VADAALAAATSATADTTAIRMGVDSRTVGRLAGDGLVNSGLRQQRTDPSFIEHERYATNSQDCI
jgi:hypothetical protein